VLVDLLVDELVDELDDELDDELVDLLFSCGSFIDLFFSAALRLCG
jgi:hypothetical protein